MSDQNPTEIRLFAAQRKVIADVTNILKIKGFDVEFFIKNKDPDGHWHDAAGIKTINGVNIYMQFKMHSNGLYRPRLTGNMSLFVDDNKRCDNRKKTFKLKKSGDFNVTDIVTFFIESVEHKLWLEEQNKKVSNIKENNVVLCEALKHDFDIEDYQVNPGSSPNTVTLNKHLFTNIPADAAKRILIALKDSGCLN